TGIGVLARVVILVVVMKAAVEVGDRADQLTVGRVAVVASVCLALHLAVLWVGYASGRLVRLSEAARVAVAFSGSQKTLPVALYLFNTYYARAYPLAGAPTGPLHV